MLSRSSDIALGFPRARAVYRKLCFGAGREVSLTPSLPFGCELVSLALGFPVGGPLISLAGLRGVGFECQDTVLPLAGFAFCPAPLLSDQS